MSSRDFISLALFFLSVSAQLVQCQNVNDYSDFDNPAVRPLITQLVYSRISNLTASFSTDIGKHSSFCIKDAWVLFFFFFFVRTRRVWDSEISSYFPKRESLLCCTLFLGFWHNLNLVSGTLIGTERLISPTIWISCLLAFKRPKVASNGSDTLLRTN